MNKTTLVVLLNLGGPSSLTEVKLFLFNLFYDKAIINICNPFRWIIAKIISLLRYKKAQKLYKLLGGSSPLLIETKKQQEALQLLLPSNYIVSICMRYTSPNSQELIQKIKADNIKNVILIPLYPQFSTCTTASSIDDIKNQINKEKLICNIKTLCCYPIEENFITAHTELIKDVIHKIKHSNYRILFSAHSVPEKIIKGGDPYQWQIEQSVLKIVNQLNIQNLDYKITYQSKVTPVKWLEPFTNEEIIKASQENKAVIICPITFVSEHVETLVELDIDYAKIAANYNVEYYRVKTLSTNLYFIKGLQNMIESIDLNIESCVKKRICPENFHKCRC